MKSKPHFPITLLTLLSTVLLFLLIACNSTAAEPTPPPPAEELIFYSWEDDMPVSVLEAFSEEYGVKVNYLTYESQEEAIENIVSGEMYDVVVVQNEFIPGIKDAGLLAEIDHQNIPNIKNLAASFRDLAYDPGNQYSIPYNWGTTGLVMRGDLVVEPVTSWTSLWDPHYAGQVAVWRGTPRETIGLTLKSLGYSVNSEEPAELEEALERMLAFKPHVVFMEDFEEAVEEDSSAPLLVEGQVVIGMGWASDITLGQEENEAITYVLPKEGAILWGDNFVIPANSPNQSTAELFLDFLLRPEIAAEITNENYYATPNEAAHPFIDEEILNDPTIFPPNEDLTNAEILLPLTPTGEKLHADIWERFLAAEE